MPWAPEGGLFLFNDQADVIIAAPRIVGSAVCLRNADRYGVIALSGCLLLRQAGCGDKELKHFCDHGTQYSLKCIMSACHVTACNAPLLVGGCARGT